MKTQTAHEMQERDKPIADNRREFLKTAGKAAAVAPAVGLLMSVNTTVAQAVSGVVITPG